MESCVTLQKTLQAAGGGKFRMSIQRVDIHLFIASVKCIYGLIKIGQISLIHFAPILLQHGHKHLLIDGNVIICILIE